MRKSSGYSMIGEKINAGYNMKFSTAVQLWWVIHENYLEGKSLKVITMREFS